MQPPCAVQPPGPAQHTGAKPAASLLKQCGQQPICAAGVRTSGVPLLPTGLLRCPCFAVLRGPAAPAARDAAPGQAGSHRGGHLRPGPGALQGHHHRWVARALAPRLATKQPGWQAAARMRAWPSPAGLPPIQPATEASSSSLPALGSPHTHTNTQPLLRQAGSCARESPVASASAAPSAWSC